MNRIGFDEAVSDYLSKIGVDADISDMSYSEYAYETNTQFGAWAFSGGRADGDTTVFEGNNQYAVYYLERAPYKLDYTVRRVRSLSVGLNDDGAADLYNLLEDWRKLDNTEENFEALSEDIVEKNAYKSEISDEMEEWLYSVDREIGDYEIIENTTELSLVRYCGESWTYFKCKAYDMMSELDFNDMLKKCTEKYNVKVK